MPTKPSTRDPIALLVIGTSLLMGAGSVVFTLLPSVQEKVGFPTWGYGLIAGSFFASSLVAQLVLARFADPRRAKMLLATAIVLGVSSLAWMAYGDSLAELSLARAVGGLATGCWGPAARVLAIDRKSDDRTAARLGSLAMGDTAGLIAGPLFGSFLASTFSIETSFLVFATLILCLTPVLFITSSPEQRPAEQRPVGQALRFGGIVGKRPVQQAALLAVALFLPVGLYETVWGKHISDLGGSSHIIALSMAFYAVPYLIAAPLGDRLGDKFGSGRATILGAGGLVLITALAGLPGHYWLLLPIGAVQAGIAAIAYTNALAMMSNACPANQETAGQGLAGAVSLAGAGVMAGVAGPLFASAGPTVAFAATAGLVGGAAAVAFAIYPAALGSGPAMPLAEPRRGITPISDRR